MCHAWNCSGSWLSVLDFRNIAVSYITFLYIFIQQLTHAAGEPSVRHAEADPPQLHRLPRLRPGAHGPVLYPRPQFTERLPWWFGECGRPSKTHHGAGGRRTARRRTQQTGPYHLHCHVPVTLPASAAYCVLHQLPAPELFLRLHAI